MRFVQGVKDVFSFYCLCKDTSTSGIFNYKNKRTLIKNKTHKKLQFKETKHRKKYPKNPQKQMMKIYHHVHIHQYIHLHIHHNQLYRV